MKRVGLKVIAWLVRALYRICAIFPSKKKIVFLSRQASKPFDFELLEPALQRAFPGYEIVWSCVPVSGIFGPRLAVLQVWHAATSRLCFVDGYVPAVCITHDLRRSRCVQLWHALGAIKYFGYQALNTPDGRSSLVAEELAMHRGYDVVVAGFSGAVDAFSRAFDIASEKILPIGLPRIDYLLESDFGGLRQGRFQAADPTGSLETLGCKGVTRILYAPTLRRGIQSVDEWFAEEVCNLQRALPKDGSMMLVVVGHPLQGKAKIEEPGICYLDKVPAIDILEAIDYVITDYSAVAFEAAVLSKKVLFYVPDIEEYRLSPGLNIDPLKRYPSISYKEGLDLISAIYLDRVGNNIRSFDLYIQDYIGQLRTGSIDRIVELSHVMLLKQGK